MGMGIDQWEWEGMAILIVFPHTSRLKGRGMSYFPIPYATAALYYCR